MSPDDLALPDTDLGPDDETFGVLVAPIPPDIPNDGEA